MAPYPKPAVFCYGCPCLATVVEPLQPCQLEDAKTRTAYIGKWHLAPTGAKPLARGLPGGYREWLAADTLEFTSHFTVTSPHDPAQFPRARLE